MIIKPRHEKTCLMPYANNKGADQPAHPRSMISTFAVRCLDSIIPILTKSRISRLKLVYVAEQTSLSLTGSHTSEDRCSRDVARFTFILMSRHEKTLSSEVCDQVRLKSVCSATENS